MLAERWAEIERLYHSARERRPEERRAYLESACSGDEELLHEVESLLLNGAGLAHQAGDVRRQCPIRGSPRREKLSALAAR